MKEDSGNHRPVSLTAVPGKVTEQLILEAISKLVEDRKVIRHSQHGSAKGKSALINLIVFYDGIVFYPSPLLSPGEASPGVLCPDLGSLLQETWSSQSKSSKGLLK